MPRAGWLAVGAVGAAWTAPFAGGLPLLAAAILLPAVGVLLAGLVALRRPGRPARVALAVGVGLVATRIVLGTLATPERGGTDLPVGERAFQASVLAVGSTAGGMQRALVDAMDVAGSDATLRLYVWLPRYPVVVPTDRIAFEAALEPAMDGPGFGEYLARNDVLGTARVHAVEVLPPEGLLTGLERLRRSAGELLARTLPAPESGLAAGILVGLRDQVDRGLAEDFTTAGLSHVVAINTALAVQGQPTRAAALRASGSRYTAESRRTEMTVADPIARFMQNEDGTWPASRQVLEDRYDGLLLDPENYNDPSDLQERLDGVLCALACGVMRDDCHEARNAPDGQRDTGIVDDLEKLIRDFVVSRVLELGVAAPARVGWDS